MRYSAGGVVCPPQPGLQGAVAPHEAPDPSHVGARGGGAVQTPAVRGLRRRGAHVLGRAGLARGQCGLRDHRQGGARSRPRATDGHERIHPLRLADDPGVSRPGCHPIPPREVSPQARRTPRVRQTGRHRAARGSQRLNGQALPRPSTHTADSRGARTPLSFRCKRTLPASACAGARARGRNAARGHRCSRDEVPQAETVRLPLRLVPELPAHHQPHVGPVETAARHPSMEPGAPVDEDAAGSRRRSTAGRPRGQDRQRDGRHGADAGTARRDRAAWVDRSVRTLSRVLSAALRGPWQTWRAATLRCATPSPPATSCWEA